MLESANGKASPPDNPELTNVVVAKSYKLWQQEEAHVKKMREQLVEREKRCAFFRHWGTSEWLFSTSKVSWRGEIPRVSPLAEEEDHDRKFKYLEDFKQQNFFSELRHRCPMDPLPYADRDIDENGWGIFDPPKKKRKTCSATSCTPVPEWVLEENDDTLMIDNTISNTDLLGPLI